jgi:hypothetical protein
MVGTSPNVDRLAELAARFAARHVEFEEFRRLLDPLRTGGFAAVEGEVALMGDLEERVTEARAVITGLATAVDREPHLDTLAGLLDDVSWELAADLRPDLEAKHQQQSALLREVGLDLKGWENRLAEIAKLIDGARLDGAPFSTLENELRAARSIVTSIRSALADRLYGGLQSLRANAEASIQALEDRVKKLAPQVDRVKQLVKQADLLIMQVAADKDFEYRVLLRSADRFQTRGINIIQDVRTLSRQDREWISGQVERLTHGLNQSLRSAHSGATRTITAADAPGDGEAGDIGETLAILGEFMFRLVIPEQIQTYLKNERWSFTITTNDLELPWELASFEANSADGTAERRYLCLERSVSRMPLGGVFPPAPARRTNTAPKKRRMLLIYSDPDGNLPAAQVEVDTIQKSLEGQIEFERVDPANATNANINRILMGQSFDFIHYAGHAYFDKVAAGRSGLKLNDTVLTANKIRLLSRGGSLVFLNACESGTVARKEDPQQVSYLLRTPEPVVGLASAFVYSGALGCVGSLWPVYDKPAAELAVNFYRYVLAGEPTGEALRQARADIRGAYPREVTWASYVLYGDPTFRLTET